MPHWGQCAWGNKAGLTSPGRRPDSSWLLREAVFSLEPALAQDSLAIESELSKPNDLEALGLRTTVPARWQEHTCDPSTHGKGHGRVKHGVRSRRTHGEARTGDYHGFSRLAFQFHERG